MTDRMILNTSNRLTDYRTEDFSYNLPEELIAQTPIEPRDNSRLFLYNRLKSLTEHKLFSDLPMYLRKGDLLVLNNTRVMPARLFGKKADAEGKFDDTSAVVEALLLKRLSLDTFEVLLKPAKRIKKGGKIVFSPKLSAEVLEILEDGNRILRFQFDGVFERILEKIGHMPLPHYIHTELKDKERYQTVYNKISGSAAAPTAGLHFTEELIEKIKTNGVLITEVTLDVGLGTFRPVKSETISKHKMHSERFSISEQSASAINKAKKEKRRVVAVGTTSVRVLESAIDERGNIKPMQGDTDIFIYPGYNFKIVDALITNFHLPCSTLIMLVSAFLGREKTLELYNEAVKEKYRFFSFGDAMFIE